MSCVVSDTARTRGAVRGGQEQRPRSGKRAAVDTTLDSAGERGNDVGVAGRARCFSCARARLLPRGATEIVVPVLSRAGSRSMRNPSNVCRMADLLLPGMAPGHTMTYADLRASGATRAGVRSALAEGLLVRGRRNVYLDASVSQAVREAQRVGGRLDCVSALAEAGIFVLDKNELHVQVEPERSRLRSPHSRGTRLSGVHGVVVHWRPCHAGSLHTVPIVEALAASVRC